jgi:hypothetical protein
MTIVRGNGCGYNYGVEETFVFVLAAAEIMAAGVA